MLLQVFGHIPKAQVLVRTAVKPLEDLLIKRMFKVA